MTSYIESLTERELVVSESCNRAREIGVEDLVVEEPLAPFSPPDLASRQGALVNDSRTTGVEQTIRPNSEPC